MCLKERNWLCEGSVINGAYPTGTVCRAAHSFAGFAQKIIENVEWSGWKKRTTANWDLYDMQINTSHSQKQPKLFLHLFSSFKKFNQPLFRTVPLIWNISFKVWLFKYLNIILTKSFYLINIISHLWRLSFIKVSTSQKGLKLTISNKSYNELSFTFILFSSSVIKINPCFEHCKTMIVRKMKPLLDTSYILTRR